MFRDAKIYSGNDIVRYLWIIHELKMRASARILWIESNPSSKVDNTIESNAILFGCWKTFGKQSKIEPENVIRKENVKEHKSKDKYLERREKARGKNFLTFCK